jgi:hypothetical protein
MNVLILPTPDQTGARGAVAAEVRGWLAKKNVRVSHLPELLGNSREYWRRRLTVGDVPLDIDNLEQLAGLLSLRITDFVVTAKTPTPVPPARGGGTLLVMPERGPYRARTDDIHGEVEELETLAIVTPIRKAAA